MKSKSARIFLLCTSLFSAIAALGYFQFQNLSLQRDLSQFQAAVELSASQQSATGIRAFDLKSAELQTSLALQQLRIGELTDELQLRRQRANPDFEQLKQRALTSLESEKLEWESTNSMSARFRMEFGQTASIKNTAGLLTPILNALQVEPELQQKIVAAISTKDNYNLEIYAQYELEGSNNLDLTNIIDARSESDIVAEFLPAEQLTQFQELRDKQRSDRMRNVYAARIDRQSGLLSSATRNLLLEGYTAMNEIQSIDDPDTIRPDPGDTKESKLLQLRDWMSEQVSEEEMLGVDIFVEAQLIANERFLNTVSARQSQ